VSTSSRRYSKKKKKKGSPDQTITYEAVRREEGRNVQAGPFTGNIVNQGYCNGRSREKNVIVEIRFPRVGKGGRKEIGKTGRTITPRIQQHSFLEEN